MRVGVAADHQQPQVDADDLPAPGDEHEVDGLEEHPPRDDDRDHREHRVDGRPEQVPSQPGHGVDLHRSTSRKRRLAMLTATEVVSEIATYTVSVMANAGTAGDPLPTVVWVTSVRS